MNGFGILGPLIGAALGARSKRHHYASRFLTGGHSSFLNASTLLAAAGLAFGAYEIFRTQKSSGPSSTTVVAGGPPPIPLAGPPPVPLGGPLGGPATLPPPIPSMSSAPSIASTPPNDFLQRLVRLTIAAARSDGDLGEDEYGRILEVARANDMESVVSSELSTPRSLAEIVGGITDPKVKSDLYVYAFSIVKADEDVSSAEREWLSRLSTLLGLDAAAVARLEKETTYRIASAPERLGNA